MDILSRSRRHSQGSEINLLAATATELQALLSEHKVTSSDLARAYLGQIQAHNTAGANLCAVISTVPEDKLLQDAERLDQMRADGKVLGPFHGIPFIVKDSMWTEPSFKLATTAGAYALKDAVAKKNADMIQLLLDAGLLLIGKANLSEMAGMRGAGGFAGWSTIGGQTQSPYVVGGVDPTDTWLGLSTPGGSSSGSAVSVASGMAPIAIGTETDGSILVPSDRAGLYSLKYTVGKVSTAGTLPYTRITDSIGPMTKCAKDVATICDVITPIAGQSHHDFLSGSFSGMKIGFLDPVEWASGPVAVRPNSDYTEQTSEDIASAIDRIEKLGARVQRHITLRRFSAEDDRMFSAVASRDYVSGFEEFVAGLDDSPISTMQELVDFNADHASVVFPPGSPDQKILEDALNVDLPDAEYEEYVNTLRNNNGDLGIDKALEEYDVDVIVGTPTGRIATVAALAGYPVGTVPLGHARFNGRLFGLAVVSRANSEARILDLMSAWEAAFPAREPPTRLGE